jgi:hypothetical protein
MKIMVMIATIHRKRVAGLRRFLAMPAPQADAAGERKGARPAAPAPRPLSGAGARSGT